MPRKTVGRDDVRHGGRRNGDVEGQVRVTAAEGVREAVFVGLSVCGDRVVLQPDLDNGAVRQVIEIGAAGFDVWLVQQPGPARKAAPSPCSSRITPPNTLCAITQYESHS